ncbi:DoxX family protein [Corynebacterium terpenotabidum]|uniref:DoxX family protein n=1 Tax=Corynebacterium terpenotabidum Y-11 TaxID=1200352 RepID=S4XEX8_9CORY|nr:DoxX family membrane protein [Corynebacterium terpenotabidum]AGP31091.1 hypothetical protein A606_07220 [Corynebacterium terpenotabidum Y-11]
MTDETKDPRHPDTDLEAVDDLGDIDVPDAPERPLRDIYAVTGRARPQKIEPKTPATEPAPEPDVATGADAADAADAADEAATTVFTSASETSADTSTETSVGTSVAAEDLDDADAATRVFDPVAVPLGAPAGDDAYARGDGTDHGTVVLDDTRPVGDLDGGPADVDAVAAAPRGTLDFGLLLLRVIVGVLLILRGAQTLFGFGGDPGVDALESRLSDVTASGILAIALPVAQLVGGGLLLLGLATPVGGAVALVGTSFLALFELSQSGAGYWPYAMSKDVQTWALLGLLGLVLIFTGPGRYSADVSRGWATRPRASAWLWALIGLAGAAALWLLTGGGNPF